MYFIENFSYQKYSTYNLIQNKRADFLKIAKNCEVQEYESNYPNQEIYHISKSSNNSTHQDGHQQHQRSSWMLSDLDKLEPDPIMTHLFERLPLSVDGSYEKENEMNANEKKLRAQMSLFNFYPSQPSIESFYVENRSSFEPPGEHKSNKILVKCTHMKFDLDLEPIWATMALYDLKEKRKISENFSFDLNNDLLKQMLNTHQTHQDVSTQSKACILNVTYPSSDLFLVVRIEKVLQQGDISECAEPYVKAQQQSASGIEKLQLNANQFCERLGKYHMPFAWTAINLTSILTTNTMTCGGSTQANIIDLDEAALTSQAAKSSSLDNKKNLGQMSKASYESFRKNTLPTASLTSPTPTTTSLNIREDSILRKNTSSSVSGPKNDELSQSLSQFKPIAISINTFFKQESDKLSDEDLFRCLSELKKSTNLIKKLKCIPGCLKMEFSPFNYEFSTDYSQLPNYLSNHFILSPELQLLKFPTNVLFNHDKQQHGLISSSQYHQSLLLHNHLLPIKDVLEFPSYSLYEPCGSYRNLLYIYPLAINLCGANQGKIGTSSIGGLSGSGNAGSIASNISSATSTSSASLLNQSSARNIAVKVNFMRGEEEHCALPILFSKHSSTQEYCKEVFINVVYHNKTPQYHDEVKLKLPALLNDANYHLLFTFYHISCQNSKDQNQLETVIGYSWLPLKQQFQYETTVYFTNNTPSGLNFSQQVSASMQFESAQTKVSSFTTKNKCSMIKGGVYSLPISFEKLPQGYSNMNYSIYDNASNNNVSFFMPNNQNADASLLSSLENLTIDSVIKDESKVQLSNIISVTTNLSNLSNSMSINNSSTSSTIFAQNPSLAPGLNSNSKSYFDVKLKLVSTVHTQDVYLERFVAISNLYSQANSANVNASNTNDILMAQAIRDLCYVELDTLCKFLYVIFDKLFFLMLNSSLSTLCFEITTRIVFKITHLLSGQNDLHKRNRMLVQ